MDLYRSYKIFVDAPKNLEEFLGQCHQVFDAHVEWAFLHKSYNKSKAHQDLYAALAEQHPAFPTGIIQSLRDEALEKIKALKFSKKPTKKKFSSIFFDKRCLSLRGNQLSFSYLNGRVKYDIKLPAYHQKYTGWLLKGATIGYDKFKKKLKICLVYKKTVEDIVADNIQPSKVLGIDRGIKNIVSISNGMHFNSKEFNRVKRKYAYLRSSLQTQGSSKAKRKLRCLSGKEQRFSLNVMHIIANWLLTQPYDIYVLEDLTGIRKQRKKTKGLNRQLHNWSYYLLEFILTYKAAAMGKTIAKVSAAYTSQMCSNCNHVDKNNRKKHRFCCLNCGYRQHADVNAALNIRNRYLEILPALCGEQVIVNEPNVSSQTCEIETSC